MTLPTLKTQHSNARGKSWYKLREHGPCARNVSLE